MREERGGFTLIEVLIALAILAMIFVMLYGTLDSTQKVATAIEAKSDVYRQAEIALSRMTMELSMLAGVLASGANEQLVFLGQDQTQMDDQRVSRPADSLQFLSFSHARLGKDIPEAELIQVSYSLDQGVLVRQEDSLQGGRELKTPLAEGILGLNFRYFDAQSQSWVDSWNYQQSRKIPLGVEISLILRDDAGQERTFIARTDFPAAKG